IEMASANTRLLFGGLIAIVLLLFFVAAVVFAIVVATCASTSGCTSPAVADFNSGWALAITTVGGLVSALVISELALTPPGKPPGARLLNKEASPRAAKNVGIVALLYLGAWVVTGIAAFVFGSLLYPGKVQQLTDLGLAWLGLAVSAAYSYLQIQPS